MKTFLQADPVGGCPSRLKSNFLSVMIICLIFFYRLTGIKRILLIKFFPLLFLIAYPFAFVEAQEGITETEAGIIEYHEKDPKVKKYDLQVDVDLTWTDKGTFSVKYEVGEPQKENFSEHPQPYKTVSGGVGTYSGSIQYRGKATVRTRVYLIPYMDTYDIIVAPKSFYLTKADLSGYASFSSPYAVLNYSYSNVTLEQNKCEVSGSSSYPQVKREDRGNKFMFNMNFSAGEAAVKGEKGGFGSLLFTGNGIFPLKGLTSIMTDNVMSEILANPNLVKAKLTIVPYMSILVSLDELKKNTHVERISMKAEGEIPPNAASGQASCSTEGTIKLSLNPDPCNQLQGLEKNKDYFIEPIAQPPNFCRLATTIWVGQDIIMKFHKPYWDIFSEYRQNALARHELTHVNQIRIKTHLVTDKRFQDIVNEVKRTGRMPEGPAAENLFKEFENKLFELEWEAYREELRYYLDCAKGKKLSSQDKEYFDALVKLIYQENGQLRDAVEVRDMLESDLAYGGGGYNFQQRVDDLIWDIVNSTSRPR